MRTPIRDSAEDLAGIDLERGTAGYKRALAATETTQDANPAPQPQPAATARRIRSDKGTTRKPSASATLTVQFDLSDDPGREFFAKTLKFWAENGEAAVVRQIAEQFAAKCARLANASNSD